MNIGINQTIMKHQMKTIITLAFGIAMLAQNADAKGGIYHKGWIDFNKNGVKDIYEDPKQPIDARVKNLLAQMTVDEKSCQLATLYGFGRVLKDSLPTAQWKSAIWKDGITNIDEQLNGVGSGYKRAYSLIFPFSNHAKAINKMQRWFVEDTRLGIPVDFSNEGIHGLNHTMATPLPAPIAIGATWNRDLVRQAGEIAGKEAKLLGYTNVYAPILDVVRDQRWGRVLECYGEEPYLIAELGTQMVQGIQREGVASTLKHYAVYSVPKGGRDGDCRTDPHVAPRELHEIFLSPFKYVIEHAHPMGVMSSYNDWNGEPITSSHYFLTQLLRDEYGFDGYVVSDSEAAEFVHTKHQVADTYDDAVKQELEAGMNVRTNFTPPSDFILPIRRLVAEKKLSMETLDKRVGEVLKVKFRLGLFDSPYVENPELADKLVGADRHAAFVEEMERQSIVLLKNAQQTLPLDKSKLKRILVTGPLADETNYMTSRYGPNGLDAVSVKCGLEDYLKGTVEVVYRKGCDVVDDHWPDSEIVPTEMNDIEKGAIADAVEEARQSDAIIVALGEDELRTGESRSRTSLELPGRQEQLLEALYATGKPVVLVLINGQPLTINWADRNVPAILEAWFPNYKGGEVIAKTLFGEYNPGGKLTVTFPKTVGQIELNFPFKKGSHGGQPGSGPNGSGKTRILGELYPFGYGLSYTSFDYSNLKINAPQLTGKDSIRVSADITNTGKYAGDEIVQLYVRDKISSVVAYDSRLCGFERITLKPGEKQTVTFTINPDQLKILDKDMKWTLEPGAFDIMVGRNSKDIELRGAVDLK
jgi:beta-glucosidase